MDRGHGKERRAASGHRVIFEGLVAVGGQGAGFEAESVDVSPDGMRLRTAYLPMPGDFLVCRFDAGTGEIAVRGEVVWCNEEARGGEFGLAFVDIDEATAKALRALVADDADEPAADEAAPAPQPAATKGNRVRLHIEGLGSPMKARVREEKLTRTALIFVGRVFGETRFHDSRLYAPNFAHVLRNAGKKKARIT